MARAKLTILATTDLHLALCPGRSVVAPEYRRGLHLAAQLGRLRKTCRNLILVDNGDFLHGGDMQHIVAHLRRDHPRRRHPMITIMNKLRYDAVALGNHEFDLGFAFLSAALRHARFPTLSANLRLPNGHQLPGFHPHILLDREVTDEGGHKHPLRIGVFSVLPRLVSVWNRDQLPRGTQTVGLVEAARHATLALRDQGADIVLGLSHSGLGKPSKEGDDENLTRAIAGLEGIDALVMGHTHEVFPGPEFASDPDADTGAGLIRGLPITQPGFRASHLGRIDLDLCRKPDGRWSSLGGRGQVIDLDTPARVPPRPRRYLRRLETLQRQYAPYLDTVIGETRVALRSHLALVGECSVASLIAAAQADHAAKALAGSLFDGLPLVSMTSALRCGGMAGPDHYVDLAAGPLTEADLSQLCPFANRLHVRQVRGWQIRDWLDHAAGIFRQIVPGQQDQPLLNPDVPPSNFDVIAGLTYRIDLTVPPRFSVRGVLVRSDVSRIKELCHGARPVRDDDLFLVAMNGFRANGGGFYPWCTPTEPQLLPEPPLILDILRAFLRATPWKGQTSRIWQFADLPRTGVHFETGPAILGGPLPETMVPMGLDERGFVRLGLCLSSKALATPAICD